MLEFKPRTSGYCRWCGKYRPILSETEALCAFGVCAFCSETDDFLEHVARLGRLARQEVKKIKKGLASHAVQTNNVEAQEGQGEDDER